MGNAGSGLPYNEGEKLEYASHWQLSEGTKRSNEAEKVCILKFDKTQKEKLTLAMRNFQKMRTLKHPGCLAYIDGVDLDAALVIVTEPCVSLEGWIKAKIAERDDKTLSRSNTEFNEAIVQEITWGIKCILNSLHFLHGANMAHGYLALHAIFVTPNGDWKLGSFDITCNLSVPEDEAFFKRHNAYLSQPFLSPERNNIDRGDIIFRSSFGVVDIFSLAKCVDAIYAKFQMPVPMSYNKYVEKMLSADFRKRPNAKQLMTCQLFATDYIKLLDSLGENALSSLADAAKTISDVTTHISAIPPFLCVHKVLPTVTVALTMSIRDFQLRDSREACRHTVGLALNLLASMVEQKKISEKQYVDKCLQGQVQLWTMSDRSVRTALLRTSRVLISFTPNKIVNDHIFDPMLAGFADSNATMREETLKNLVHVVEKLEGKHMLDKLVRCIVNLQNDQEPSLRTNATIFLGKIANKLDENACVRVVFPAFVKSMKDPVLHCRLAGLKASMACISLLDLVSLVNKVLPQVAILAMDAHPEVRELALSVTQACVEMLREHHEKMKLQQPWQPEVVAHGQANAHNHDHTGSANTNKQQTSQSSISTIGSSWVASLVPAIATMDVAAQQQQLAANREKRSVSASSAQSQGSVDSISQVGTSKSGFALSSSANISASTATRMNTTSNDVKGDEWESGDEYDNSNFRKGMMNISSTKAKSSNGWDDDLNLDDDLDNGFSAKPLKVSTLGIKKEKAEKNQTPKKLMTSKDSGWDDMDMDALNFDDRNSETSQNAALSIKTSVSAASNNISNAKADSALKSKAEKGDKPLVAKLSAASSGWDDFDDLNLDSSPSARASTSRSSASATVDKKKQEKIPVTKIPATGWDDFDDASASTMAPSSTVKLSANTPTSTAVNRSGSVNSGSEVSADSIKSVATLAAPAAPKGMQIKGQKVAAQKLKKSDDPTEWENF